MCLSDAEQNFYILLIQHIFIVDYLNVLYLKRIIFFFKFLRYILKLIRYCYVF